MTHKSKFLSNFIQEKKMIIIKRFMAEINYPYTHNSEMSPQIILTSLHKR